MSDRNDHSEHWQDEIAAHALDALEPRETALLEQHLDGCGECAERLRWISPAIDMLPASVAPLTPPPEMRERLMAIVSEEAAVDAPAQRERRSRLPSFGGFALRPAFALAATALLIVAGVAGYELRNETTSPSPGSETFTAAALDGSAAFGSLKIDGDEGSLRVANLPATERGDVYQAWIKDAEGSIHPSSVFVLSEDGTGSVSIPSGLTDADRVMVTREPKGGSKLPTEDPVLAAELD